MKIVFSSHAKLRFEQRAHLNINAGYSFINRAMKSEINPIHENFINKYREKNLKTDPSITIIAYKHLMFAVRITETKIFVITVMVIH